MCLGEENSQTCWGGGRHNLMIKKMSSTMICLSNLSWEFHERGEKKEYNHLQAYWMNQHFSGVRKQLCTLWLRRWGNGSNKNMDKMSSQWSSFFPQAWTLSKFSITFQLSGGLSIASPRTRTSGQLTILGWFWGKITHFPGCDNGAVATKRKFHFIIEAHINMWRGEMTWCLMSVWNDLRLKTCWSWVVGVWAGPWILGTAVAWHW